MVNTSEGLTNKIKHRRKSSFWDGDPSEAQQIIRKIKIPGEVGALVLPNKNLNGPSSKVLSENILKPLSVTRQQAWLCDLLPESRLNPNQLRVISEKYNPLIEKYGLNEVTVPPEYGNFVMMPDALKSQMRS